MPGPGPKIASIPQPQAAPADPVDLRAERHHRRHRRLTLALTLALLAVWALVSFGVSYFARDLSFDFFGWPFSFWVGAQGGVIVYGLIVAVYAWVMNRRERD